MERRLNTTKETKLKNRRGVDEILRHYADWTAETEKLNSVDAYNAAVDEVCDYLSSIDSETPEYYKSILINPAAEMPMLMANKIFDFLVLYVTEHITPCVVAPNEIIDEAERIFMDAYLDRLNRERKKGGGVA